jgi:hypothetical protein
LIITKGVKYTFFVLAVIIVAVLIWGYLTGGILFLASAAIVAGMFLYMIYDSSARKSAFRREQEAKLSQAKNFEKSGRYEEAAQLYEGLKMWDKAGEMRKKDRTFYHEGRTVNMNLDLNNLLNQVRAEGISVPYRCPNCGGSTRIDSNTYPNNIRTRKYCRFEFEQISIVDFLSSLLK